MDCTECNVEIHEHNQIFWNCEDEPVCEDCANLLPKYCVGFIERLNKFYGHAEFKGCEMSSGFTPDKRVAKKEILEMCRKLWGAKINPVQEDDQ